MDSWIAHRWEQGRRLQEDIDALRDLPPGTQPSPPLEAEERQLLADLLQRPSGSDPLRWLRDARGPLTARIALQAQLRHLSGWLGLFRLNLERGVPNDRTSEQLLGGLPPAPAATLLLNRVNSIPVLPPDVLLDTLARLRLLRGDVPLSATVLHQLRDSPSALLTDLLLLDERDDPLRWLMQERGDQIAHVALTQLLDRFVPVPSPTIGSIVATRRFSHMLRAGPLRVVVKELLLGTEGFTVGAEVRISTRGPSPLLTRPFSSSVDLAWTGFHQAVDDHGYRYLSRVNVGDGGYSRRLWWRRGRYQASFYPSVFAEARQLTFGARPATVSAIANQLTADFLPAFNLLPYLRLSDLTWQVGLPGVRTGTDTGVPNED